MRRMEGVWVGSWIEDRGRRFFRSGARMIVMCSGSVLDMDFCVKMSIDGFLAHSLEDILKRIRREEED